MLFSTLFTASIRDMFGCYFFINAFCGFLAYLYGIKTQQHIEDLENTVLTKGGALYYSLYLSN